MQYRNLIKSHYNEINNLTNLLSSMVNSYRLLVGGANELNNISEAKKSQVKEAVKRADDLGEIIDEIIKTLDECSTSYTKYCKIKKQYVDEKTNKDNILTEIDYEVQFDNSEREYEE
ncbi:MULTISPECIES: hypothetical protein [Clostridium]|uniref:hypothetical protein n=1 Tax=Clostridium TaxID=1485 RepID=UPI00062E718E|nr:hypothetical protein [Clostridium sp. C8]KLE16947.1 hypothetical protein AAT22_03665 [Clostridium sp. C8]